MNAAGTRTPAAPPPLPVAAPYWKDAACSGLMPKTGAGGAAEPPVSSGRGGGRGPRQASGVSIPGGGNAHDAIDAANHRFDASHHCAPHYKARENGRKNGRQFRPIPRSNTPRACTAIRRAVTDTCARSPTPPPPHTHTITTTTTPLSTPHQAAPCHPFRCCHPPPAPGEKNPRRRGAATGRKPPGLAPPCRQALGELFSTTPPQARK